MGWLEAVDRHIVSPRADLDGVELVRSADDSIWTFIGCLERCFSRVGSDKNELCLSQVVLHVDFDGTMGAGGDWFEVTDFLAELSEVILDRCLWSTVRVEISRHCQSGTVD